MTFILLFLYTWLDLWLAMVRWWNTAVVVDIKIRSRIEDNVNKSPGKVGEQPSNFPQSGIASNRGRKLHLPACLPLLSAAADVICRVFKTFISMFCFRFLKIALLPLIVYICSAIIFESNTNCNLCWAIFFFKVLAKTPIAAHIVSL